MDMPRDPAFLTRRRRRRWLVGGAMAIVALGVSVAVARMEPAAPSIANSQAVLWFGTVKRGPMVREVRGAGTLVPEEIRWIPATTAGRVERILLQPGARVEPDTVIVELSNPDLEQSARSAELEWQSAIAQLGNQRVSLASTRASLEAAIVDYESAYEVALADFDMHRSLAGKGLIAEITLKQKQAVLNQASNRLGLAKRQLTSAVDNAAFQLAPLEAGVNQRKAAWQRLAQQVADLRVKATMTGQLQLIAVERGQQVGPGTNLARVSDPTRLKAELRISDTQTRDLAIGQRADVDTRSGHVPGEVVRIDPASRGGTVGVDVRLLGPLPAGARPDLGIDGTIELERLANVLFVESPPFGQEQSTISLFKVFPGGEARRTPVAVGRRSVQFIEVVQGLQEGDRVVLTDMSQYDSVDRVRLD
ncbi:MAG: HlyD family efflux transporter periplasmic adaptor subunit [Acidobacteria bacterium]|nr:HlyD family efflux transporter periplasmic adaptor subunit [Acidobacteriota bacterium]